MTGIAVDSNGNRYICGAFFNDTDFNPNLGSDVKICNAIGGANTFVTRYNANGSYAWTQTFGGSNDDEPANILVSGSTRPCLWIFTSTDAGIGAVGIFITLTEIVAAKDVKAAIAVRCNNVAIAGYYLN